jgi:multiple sugar transport system substrate-binding protein
MNRSRLLTVLSLIAILALVLAACAQPTPTAKPEEEEEPTQGATPVAEEKVTITVWDFGGEMSWMDTIAIPAFQGRFPNVEIKHVGVPEEELGTKLETAIAAREVPDLVLFPPPRVIAAGHVLPLDEYMQRDGISRDDYCTLFHASNLFAGGNIYNDKVVSLPIDTNIWAMMYNKDLFAQAGLPEVGPDDVIDFDTWLTYARAINKPAETLEERVWGSNLFFPIWNSMNNYMSDPYVLGDDGRTCVGNADTDDWMHFWDIQVTAYNEDLTTWSAGALLVDVEEDMFLQGKLGMTECALGDALFAREQGLNVGLTGQPVVSKGWPGNVGGWNTSYSIMAASKHPDEAWEFLKYLSTEAPKDIPIGTDALNAGGGGIPGLPCYLPLLEVGRTAELVKDDPLIADAIILMQHIKMPPFTPDIWTSANPFNDAWTRMIEEDVDVTEAINDAVAECQEVTDQLWEDFDALGK